MSLKGLNHSLGAFIEDTSDGDFVAIKCQHGLQRLDRLAVFATCQKPPAADRRRLEIVADTRLVEPLRGEVMARVCLARRCNIRMGQNIFRLDGITLAYIATEADDRLDLRILERRIVFEITRIDDLDADGSGIDVRFALPEALARMRARAFSKPSARSARLHGQGNAQKLPYLAI